MRISLSNRVKVECRNNTYAIDGTPKEGEIGVLTHAHADHLPGSTDHKYICSDLTSSLGAERIGSFDSKNDDADVKLFNAGHIPGSRSVLIEDNNETALITGDFNTRDTILTDGFDFDRTVDKLVVESTYGHPRYKFPSQDQIESEIVNWFDSVSDCKIVCRGYSLGRAQEIELLARKANIDEILVNRATKNINKRINKFYERDFSTNKLSGLRDLDDGQLYITSNKQDLKSVPDVFDPKETRTGAFTGWALRRDYENSNLYDAGFPLSDHSDYTGLIETVQRIQPSTVYTMHGYKDSLADSIVSETGIESKSLKKDQKTLSDFS